jgi:methionyl-tRNA synthetase
VLANLAPRKLMGVTSEGMILAAEDRGNVFLLTTDGDAPPGSRVL